MYIHDQFVVSCWSSLSTIRWIWICTNEAPCIRLSSTYVEITITFYLFSSFMPGVFSCENKANYPNKCSAGTYAIARSIKCQPCPKGAHCPTDGLSMYVLCANGTYSDAEGQSVCKPCDAGYRCPSLGMEAPQLCPNGTYSNTTGARECVLCPAGFRWGFISCYSVTILSMRCTVHTHAFIPVS